MSRHTESLLIFLTYVNIISFIFWKLNDQVVKIIKTDILLSVFVFVFVFFYHFENFLGTENE